MNTNATTVPAIRAKGIGVAFGGISVLRDVTLDIMPGEIHGLIGENGAGKSTLGKVLGGYYSASAGALEVFGTRAHPWNPPAALARGVAIMHQELQLVPDLTVAQNVFLGIEEHRFGVLKTTEAARLDALMASSGFQLQPNAVVSTLPIADQQKIEILRALARHAKVIVMDEPTSSLSKGEITQLHEAMKALRDEGRTVIYVSHFLDDIMETTDRVTVLRDGALVATKITTQETKSSLVSAMLGDGKTETPFPQKKIPANRTAALQVNGIASRNGANGATLHVNKGEIVGLIGLVGSGRSEIARAIIGADPATSGEVVLEGAAYGKASVAKSNDLGMVMVPEDRRKQGLVMTIPVCANMTLPHLSQFSLAGIIRSGLERLRAGKLIDHFSVRPADLDGNILNYSGGNQQKVLISKWLMEDPRVILLDEPSRGVDVGARETIHNAIAELAEKGAAVLLISSEIEEVLGLAHRAYLVDRGRIVEEIDPATSDVAEVLAALFRHQGTGKLEEAS